MSEQVPQEKAASPVGSLLRRGVPLVVLLLVVAGTYLYWQHVDGEPEPETPNISARPIPVSVTTIQLETVPVQMRFLGQTEAAQVVEIRARVAGYLQERFFQEGQQVKQGQKLFQIDPRPFEVSVAQAKAGLASAEATLERAGQQLARVEQLVRRGASSVEEAEDWQTQQRVAAARVQEQHALIAAAELDLNYASIESPIDGVIGRVLKDPGSYVDAGPNGQLAVVQQVDPMYVRYSVTEQQILRFRRQEKSGEINVPDIQQLELEITLSDGSVYPHRGHINFIDVQVDRTTGTSVIRGQVPNPDNLLKPGQFIHASLLGVQRVNVVRVPQAAVRQSPSGASVLVVNAASEAEMRPVTLGEWSGTEHWIIEQGLKPGDRVITDRLLTVRPGIPVEVVAAPGTSSEGPAK